MAIDLTSIPLDQPIEPYIECDGGYYAICHRCWTEIEPKNKTCPKCNQTQDWSWLKGSDKTE